MSVMHRFLLGLAFVWVLSSPGWAGVLNGSSVNGVLHTGLGGSTNYYDINDAGNIPAFVPLPYLNHFGLPVTISGTDTEFGWCACGASTTYVTADFTDTGLSITTFSNFTFQFGWIQTFTDAAFSGLSISTVSDNFPYNGAPSHLDNGISASLVGDVLTLSWPGQAKACPDCANVGPFAAEFSFSPKTPSVPEPGTLALFGAGIVGVGALRRRKARK